MTYGEGETIAQEQFDEAYNRTASLLSAELNRPFDEQLHPQSRQEMESVFIGLYTAKYFPEQIDEATRTELVRRGLMLQEPERRWTHTNSYARFVRWFNLQG